MKWILIASGGAIGSVARYWMQGAVYSLTGLAFPLGTIAVNVLGCFLIGLLYATFNGPLPVRDEIRIGLMVGVLGGFTTFSAFSLETLVMAHEGRHGIGHSERGFELRARIAGCVVWASFRRVLLRRRRSAAPVARTTTGNGSKFWAAAPPFGWESPDNP